MKTLMRAYRCQNCGFTFERRSEPESCPQCGRSYLLEVPPEEWLQIQSETQEQPET